ncbi:MAG: toll/interleukin-1 receptor domain-containing protein [Verrucomicrobia bacterium]|nr:toll/interleukin-1 receptor domain-containing protein [Verrucomicrobiota bacterium]
MSTETGNEKTEASDGQGGVEPKVPLVFISYSHDSEEHKAWVLMLAERLIGAGVGVILDRWDVGPGDDLVKYMRQAVSRADRVLMICTAEYVRKADGGEGGVGYEAMVVDGELVRDQGENKFIPVLRQRPGEEFVPKSVSTRVYTQLSDDRSFEAGFEELARNIQDTPKLRKPPLGKNPYAARANIEGVTAALEGVATGGATAAGVLTDEVVDAETAYLTGLEIARGGDVKAWRELAQRVKEPLSGRLNAWRKKQDGRASMTIAELPNMVLEAATIYSPLMALALAGVESGEERFTKQGALLDEFLKPRDWNSSGLVVVGRIPAALVFTFQALHGATCVDADVLELGMRLSRARIADAHQVEALVLHTQHGLVGAPESFQSTTMGAWRYLTELPEKWPWLKRVFGTDERYLTALCAYYMALSVQELACRIMQGQTDFNQMGRPLLDIPTGWLTMPRELQRKAYGRLIEAETQTRKIWRSLGVADSRMAAAWPEWVEQTKCWNGESTLLPSYFNPVHATLFEDLRPEDVQL